MISPFRTRSPVSTAMSERFPYKEYFSNTVYAMKYFGKDGIDKGPTHGTFKDSWFAAVGQATIEDVMKDTPHSFNDKDYGGLCFTAKTGIELESVTFTVVAQKECYVKINLYGPKIDTEGKFELWNNSIVTSASSVSFKNGNYTTLDGSKLIKLTPNVPLTFTVDTLMENEEFPRTKEDDFGKITEACRDDETARRFLLSVAPYRIKNGYIGDYYWYESFTEAEFGIRLYNISFEVKKLED